MRLKDLKIGSGVQRIMEGFVPNLLFVNDGTVKSITNDVITCEILVDQPHVMEFDAKTGVNILGFEYGWLNIKGQLEVDVKWRDYPYLDKEQVFNTKLTPNEFIRRVNSKAIQLLGRRLQKLKQIAEIKNSRIIINVE